MMPFNYYTLYPFLNLRTEVGPMGRINSPVHKTKAVCWTDDGVTEYVENGPVVDFDEIQVTTRNAATPLLMVRQLPTRSPSHQLGWLG
jgi:hypothetical protein